ncbi:hypothetical protein [Arenimonas donghaensis]|uniref:Uncharacterized protein n=1 Tax=Arenimonas donghaensis DSM 18148 = HO3-R19 TaxID=1121014 RepID=A0A087MJS0_9GAMM|nr:hypothetical protein [Arenimonas donghaensis]KFL37123.1 hypothetical protein N788_11395 [Arenimonas donghaensis DSM 18148 = HO3-R19]
MSERLPLAVLLSASLLTACGGKEPAPATGPADDAQAAAKTFVAGSDWGPCRIQGLRLPLAARLFVIDGGTPTPGAEPGREMIRRVDIAVPGPVALLMTAPEATAWHVRPGPETEVRALVALGEEPQRITGLGLGDHRHEASAAMGAECAGYLMRGGAGPALAEATDQIFGKPHDAIYQMRIGSVIIGGSDPTLDQPVGQ